MSVLDPLEASSTFIKDGYRSRKTSAVTGLLFLSKTKIQNRPLRKSKGNPYLGTMPQRRFEPCIPARAAAVPAGPDWIYEIKHDGYPPDERFLIPSEHGKILRRRSYHAARAPRHNFGRSLRLLAAEFPSAAFALPIPGRDGVDNAAWAAMTAGVTRDARDSIMH